MSNTNIENKTAENRTTDKKENVFAKAKNFVIKHRKKIAIGAGLGIATYILVKKGKAPTATPASPVIEPVVTPVLEAAPAVLEDVADAAQAVVETASEIV